ncbi:MAG: ABC transporter permease [Anaerolineae bacterium]
MLTSLRVLTRITTMIFRRGITYSVEWLFGIFRAFLSLWVEIAVWTALLANTTVTATGTTSPVTVADMVTYLVVAEIVLRITTESVSEDMERRLGSGDIAGDLVRPVGFPFLVLGRSLGQAAVRVLSNTLPAVLLVALVWGVKPPASAGAALLSLAATGVGLVVSYALGYVFGIIGFYMWSTEHFQWVLDAFFRIVSGAVIPFWFLPGWVKAIGNALPFQTMAYTPVGLYLGKIPPADAVSLLGLGLLWAVALLLAARFWWQRALRRLVVQGG